LGEPKNICRSPFADERRQGDANPSFSTFADGQRWKDCAAGEAGGAADPSQPQAEGKRPRRARSICHLGRVTDEFTEKRVAAVWLKVSNNGEAEGTKTALQLGESATLEPIPDFDWSEWEGSTSGWAKREAKVREEHLRNIFEDGKRWCSQKVAADPLQERSEVGRSAAYDADAEAKAAAALL